MKWFLLCYVCCVKVCGVCCILVECDGHVLCLFRCCAEYDRCGEEDFCWGHFECFVCFVCIACFVKYQIKCYVLNKNWYIPPAA